MATHAAAPTAAPIAQADFLGGPFFGRHGYYYPPGERRYFYHRGVAGPHIWRRHHRSRYCWRHPAACGY